MTKLTEYIEEHRLVHLPEGTPREQVEAILDRPDVEAYVPAIDGPVLYDLIQRAGWNDAQPLMAYVSAEQLQTFVDLDCWRRDEFQPHRLEPWLAAVLAETSDASFRRHCRETDPEILAMYFKANLLVDLMDEEGMIPDAFWDREVDVSPDGVYAIVYPEDEATAALLRSTLDRLYEVDRVLAWTLLEAARWELLTPMEDAALHWRRSRMEELGFVDFDEAMTIYRPLDPAVTRERLESRALATKPVVAGPSTLPALPPTAADDRFFVVRVMQRLGDEELAQAVSEFVALQNRAFTAEGIEPAETEHGQFVAERTTGYLSIGLEFLSRGDEGRAVEVLREMPLRDVFRCGFTTVDRLRDTVSRLRRRPTSTIVDGVRFSLLRGADESLCESLLTARPMYSDAVGSTPEIFHTQAQVDDAALRLGLIAFKQMWLFGIQGVSPGELVRLAYGDVWANEAIDVTFDAIFGTWVACRLLDRPPDMYGLSAGEVAALPARVAGRLWEGKLLDTFEGVVGRTLEALPAAARLLTRWLEATVTELEEELGPLQEVDNPAYFTSILLVQKSGADA